MNRYTHLTIEEREKARCLLEQGLSIRAIARILKRSPSSVLMVSCKASIYFWVLLNARAAEKANKFVAEETIATSFKNSTEDGP